jgi:hypothetical protein
MTYLTQEQVLDKLGITEAEFRGILIAVDDVRRAGLDRIPGVFVCVAVPNEVPTDATVFGIPVLQGPTGVLLRVVP